MSLHLSIWPRGLCALVYFPCNLGGNSSIWGFNLVGNFCHLGSKVFPFSSFASGNKKQLTRNVVLFWTIVARGMKQIIHLLLLTHPLQNYYKQTLTMLASYVLM